jgi:hypothetical protein
VPEGSWIRAQNIFYSQELIRKGGNEALQVGKRNPKEILGSFTAIYPIHKGNIITAAQQLERRYKKGTI